MSKKKNIFILTLLVLIMGVVIAFWFWRNNDTQISNSQAKEIVMETTNEVNKMENYLWSDKGFPVEDPNTFYVIPGCGEYKTYQKTNDFNINTIEEVKTETEKVFTKEAAQEYLYHNLLEVEAPYYVEYESELYKNFDISIFGSLGIYKDAEILECSKKRIVANVYSDMGQTDELLKSKVEFLYKNGNWYINSIEYVYE